MARDSRKAGKAGKAPRSEKLTTPVGIPRPKDSRSARAARPEKPKAAAAAGYPPFAVTVDLVVFTIVDSALHVLLVERGEKPHKGQLALPGGFVRIEEDLQRAAYRELAEETGITSEVGHLEQLRSYGRPERDPRMRTVSVAYLALAPGLPEPVAGTDAATARWVPVGELLAGEHGPLAFDHGQILDDGLERARAKLEYSSLATAFCPAEFTVSQLREVYEAVWGGPIDPRNFHRKATRTTGFLEATGRHSTGEAGRPAQLYRRGPVDTLNPPMTRAGG